MPKKYTIYHSTYDKDAGCWESFSTEKEALEHVRYEFDIEEESLGRKIQTLNEMFDLKYQCMEEGYEFKYEPDWYTTTIEIDDDNNFTIVK
jgi:hypothetical protein